jgi:modification methylase
MFVNHKPRILNGRLWSPASAFTGIPLRQNIIWNTGPGVNINPGAFTPAHEYVMLFADADWRFNSRAAGKLGDVWSFPPERNAIHPATFPIALPLKCIQAAPGRTVGDPFCGTGTTMLAAKLLKWKAIGVDSSERYCEIAANRLAQGVLAL